MVKDEISSAASRVASRNPNAIDAVPVIFYAGGDIGAVPGRASFCNCETILGIKARVEIV